MNAQMDAILNSSLTPDRKWQNLTALLPTLALPFSEHLKVFTHLFPNWIDDPISAPAFIPTLADKAKTHLHQLMKDQHLENISACWQWSVKDKPGFWQYTLNKLNIIFQTQPVSLLEIPASVENAQWLKGARLNIVESCFKNALDKSALIFLNTENQLDTYSYRQLKKRSEQVARSLVKAGFKPQEKIALIMPMHPEAIAIYLGIVLMGAVVVSIADSFSSEEIAIRLSITETKAVFTQDKIKRHPKIYALYEKIQLATRVPIIVYPLEKEVLPVIEPKDYQWQDFLISEGDFTPFYAPADAYCHILFSSGTTGTPKAIPWTHTTCIKVASDSYYHQDIHPHDTLCWPTNLGWMMGAWSIFAALINGATLALYTDTPNEQAFGQFIQHAKVTVLGIVPTLVASWRASKVMEKLDWHWIKCFSSSGECSNSTDMLYLMFLAGYRPIIEYCGGTEIGGAYISSTLVENNYLSVFTTPALGSDFLLIDDEGNMNNDEGSVALIPPQLGLSQSLLNADHHAVYFNKWPALKDGTILRSHGDHLIRLSNHMYRITGRSDESMNLGGIKVSSVEIERTLVGIEHVLETAAIGIMPPGNGPTRLVIFVVATQPLDIKKLHSKMQEKIRQHLNPLFKIFKVQQLSSLPKTASLKILRRQLQQLGQDSSFEA